MSVSGEPEVPEENVGKVQFTYGIFKTKEGIPFLALVPIIDGKPFLSRIMPLTDGLEQFEKLFEVIKTVLEGPKPRTRMYD